MRRRGGLVLALWAFGSIWAPHPAVAGQQASSADDPSSASAASALPVAPAVITRTPEGQATVRAVRIARPPTFDGRLDDAVYQSTLPIDGFIQQEPQEGAPATEKTDAWIFFDDDSLYISFRLWESRPDALVANEMRRDSNNIFQNDHIAFLLDTFHDRRNGNEFAINAIGGRWDGQISNERSFNADWNPIWDLEVGRFDQGWTVEAVIPFKSLRYRPGRDQIWASTLDG